MSVSKVSTNMQRDLVSKTSKAADLDDFNQGTKVSFQVGMQTLSTRGTEVNQKQRQDDTVSNRSVKSEFDYGSKKKFVDILGNNT